jgi:[ribosomal protein S5]-alanine N-acetyltransferase
MKTGNMRTQAVGKRLEHPVIETDRLFLRMFEARDLEAAHRLFNDGEVQKYLSPKNRRTREQLEASLKKFVGRWDERGFGLWCVTEKHCGEMIGYCGFQNFEQTADVEIVFGYLKEYWGKGVATEALKACLNFGMEKLSFEKIFAVTNPANIGSIRVLEKSGMSFLEREFHYGMETVIYSISKD